FRLFDKCCQQCFLPFCILFQPISYCALPAVARLSILFIHLLFIRPLFLSAVTLFLIAASGNTAHRTADWPAPGGWSAQTAAFPYKPVPTRSITAAAPVTALHSRNCSG